MDCINTGGVYGQLDAKVDRLYIVALFYSILYTLPVTLDIKDGSIFAHFHRLKSSTDGSFSCDW